eukprot:NODE_748_length_2789_cov_5.825695.p1 GENE.NODE_748_length_2789_cov_5.825695~~NODE_748_length_2789_cov_5.825695.p1  ORF type:complete len:559 (-),score=109.99 NODE_748_length_2789_cov_5.825695:498-2174(-)
MHRVGVATVAPITQGTTVATFGLASLPRASTTQVRTAVPEAVPGISVWLRQLGLEAYAADAARWADEQGACDVAELAENFDEFAAALGIEPARAEELRPRAQETAEAAAQNRSQTPVAAVPAPIPASFAACAQAEARPLQIVPKPLGQDATRCLAAAPLPQRSSDPDDMPRTVTEQWDEMQAEAERRADAELSWTHKPFLADRKCANVDGETGRQVKVRVRRTTLQYDTPPKQRCRVDEHLLRTRIPSEAELRLAEEIRAEAIARRRVEFPDEVKRDAAAKPTAFEEVRNDFLVRHGSAISNELGGGYELVPADVSERVQHRFVSTVQSTGVIPDYGYHGTRKVNIPNILEKGLLVPSIKSGINVVHGAAHGTGIYTALPGNAWLSRNFCDSPNLLICGVVDSEAEVKSRPPPSAPQAAPPRQTGGGHHHHHRPATAALAAQALPPPIYAVSTAREDANVKVVGAARIIKNACHAAPLFLAQRKTEALIERSEDVPSKSIKAHRDQVYIKEADVCVWSQPEPTTGYWQAVHVKRRVVDKEQKRQRAAQREAKFTKDDG